GVPYRDSAARQRYGNYDRQAAQAREQFRGREGNLGGASLNDRAGVQSDANRGVASQGGGQLGGGNRDFAGNRAGGGEFNRGGGGSAGNLGANRGAGSGAGFNVGNGA